MTGKCPPAIVREDGKKRQAIKHYGEALEKAYSMISKRGRQSQLKFTLQTKKQITF